MLGFPWLLGNYFFSWKCLQISCLRTWFWRAFRRSFQRNVHSDFQHSDLGKWAGRMVGIQGESHDDLMVGIFGGCFFLGGGMWYPGLLHEREAQTFLFVFSFRGICQFNIWLVDRRALCQNSLLLNPIRYYKVQWWGQSYSSSTNFVKSRPMLSRSVQPKFKTKLPLFRPAWHVRTMVLSRELFKGPKPTCNATLIQS